MDRSRPDFALGGTEEGLSVPQQSEKSDVSAEQKQNAIQFP